MEWDGIWNTQLPKATKLSTINDWFLSRFPGYPRLSLQPVGREQEEDYPYAEGVVRACELLDEGTSFTVWLTKHPGVKLEVTLKNDDDPGLPVRRVPEGPPPRSSGALVAREIVYR
jgi:hypothetical protein